jgi:hypothetical protein
MEMGWTRREMYYNINRAAPVRGKVQKKRGEPKLPSRKNIK